MQRGTWRRRTSGAAFSRAIMAAGIHLAEHCLPAEVLTFWAHSPQGTHLLNEEQKDQLQCPKTNQHASRRFGDPRLYHVPGNGD